jgi:hypothetical protein
MVIGRSIADHLRTELVIDALGTAIIRRAPADGGTSCILITARNARRGIRAAPAKGRSARIDGNDR